MRPAPIISGLVLLAVMASAVKAEPPGEAEIGGLAVETERTYSEFMEVSTNQRLHFEFFGSFDEKEAAVLLEMSRQVSNRFASIAAQAEALSLKIEEYEGDDWEKRYGSTGLWRRLKAEICRARMFECEARYWSAIAAGGDERQNILSDTSRQITSLECDSRSLRLLDAKVLCASGKEGSNEWRKGMDILEDLCEGAERDGVYISSMLIRYRQTAMRNAQTLERAWASLKSGDQADGELWLNMGFAGWAAGRQGWLEAAVSRCPQSRGFIGKCVLAEVQRRLTTDGASWIGPYAAGLAAEAALVDVHKYKGVVNALGGVKTYRGTSVLYSMAQAAEDSEPLKAAELLVEASRLMDGDDAVWAADRATRLAYAEFCKDKKLCKATASVIRNYLNISGDSGMPGTRYCYYVVLRECGDANEARSVLEKIAGSGSGEYQKRAAYELGVMRAGESMAQGRLTEAARELASALTGKSGENIEPALEIVSRYLDMQEEYQSQPGHDGLAQDCRLLAKYCATWMQGDQKYRAGLMLAEIMIASCAGDDIAAIKEVIDKAAKELAPSDEDLTRCRARMLMAKGDWENAGSQWGAICEQRVYDTDGTSRSWHWWRAKYYQLLSWSKGKDATKEELTRRIEVIRNSCGPVPLLWDAKLKSL